MLRALRLFRIFRLLKSARYFNSMQRLVTVLRAKKEELTITLFAVRLLLLFSSTLMYLVENEAQPDKFSSIPATMWWGVATLTTVGYGDIYAITPLGRVVGGVMALLGVGAFALPAGIIASGFSECFQQQDDPTAVCPHCGK